MILIDFGFFLFLIEGWLYKYYKNSKSRITDKRDIEVMIRKEIKDFLNANTVKQFENKIIEGSLIKKREDIELIHAILEKNLEDDLFIKY